jgi:hypothetical protein
MRRQSAAAIGLVAMAITAGSAPSASAQPGETYIRTTSNVRCVINAERAACERASIEGFPAAPANQSGGHWHVASVDANGHFSWAEANIGPSIGQEIALVNGQPYHFHGWTLLLTTDGTRLTNDANTHGMNISIDGVVVTPY